LFVFLCPYIVVIANNALFGKVVRDVAPSDATFQKIQYGAKNIL
jgi:hypothetical protein